MNKIALLKMPFQMIMISSFLLLMSISGQASVTDEAYRKELTQEIVDNWKGKNPTTNAIRWEAGIRVWLEKLSTDDLLNALEANTYEDLTILLSSKAQNLASSNSLSGASVVTGKLYYSLNPCRLVDTRMAFGVYTGPIGNATSMNFHAKDALEIQNQGGKVGGCNVPPNAAALVINITSVSQSPINGFLTAYPFGAPRPLAAILTYVNAPIGNSTILPVCTGTCGADFSVYVSSTTQVIVDVMGYFAD